LVVYIIEPGSINISDYNKLNYLTANKDQINRLRI